MLSRLLYHKPGNLINSERLVIYRVPSNAPFKQKQEQHKNFSKNDKLFQKELNLYVEKITFNIEKFHFNKVVANIYELTNYVQKQYDEKKVHTSTLLEFINTYAKLILLLIGYFC